MIKDIIGNKDVQSGIVNAVAKLQYFCHGLAVEAGWWSDLETGQPMERNKGECYALMHSELSEGLEGMRKGLMDDHLSNRNMEEVELADTIIRIMDYAGAHNLDVGGALAEKLAYNVNRADHKIENRKAEGGKKI